MNKDWIAPKLVMGSIVCIGPDDEEAVPYDEAVIHLEGDEDSEIEIRCPAAARLAPLIVKAVNHHDELVEALKDASLQIEYLQERLSTSTGVAALSRINYLLGRVGTSTPGEK